MKITLIVLIEILLWSGHLIALPDSSDVFLSHESTSDRRSLHNIDDMEPSTERRRPLFRMSMNQHWLVHTHVRILPTTLKELDEKWVVSATQLVPFESPMKPKLGLEEPLLFEHGIMRIKVPINASVTLILPRRTYNFSGTNNGLHHHSEDQESLWAIALIRTFKKEGQNRQDRQYQLIMRSIITFPQRIPILDRDQCTSVAAFNDCPLYYTSPVATVHLNATTPFHLVLYRNDSVKTRRFYFPILVPLFILMVSYLAVASSHIRGCTRNSTISVLVQRLTTLISTHIKNRITFRRGHDTPRFLRSKYDCIDDAYDDRLEESSNISWYVSDCNSPPQHESLWFSAYSYYDDDDETNENLSEPLNADPKVELSPPPFITRKFATTVWSYSALLEHRTREPFRVEHSRAEYMENPFAGEMIERSSDSKSKNLLTEEMVKHGNKTSDLGNREDYSDYNINMNTQQNESNNHLVAASVAKTQDGDKIETFELLHHDSIRNQPKCDDPGVMDGARVHNAQQGESSIVEEKDQKGMEISFNHTSLHLSEMSQGDSTITDLCESWSHYGEDSSFYDPQVTTRDCVKGPVALLNDPCNDQQQQRKCTAQVLLNNTKPRPCSIITSEYKPSEDILNQSRSLLEPVWLFRPSPSAIVGKNTTEENKTTQRRRSDRANRGPSQGQGVSSSNRKTKRNADIAMKRNVKAKTDRSTK